MDDSHLSLLSTRVHSHFFPDSLHVLEVNRKHPQEVSLQCRKETAGSTRHRVIMGIAEDVVRCPVI